jgi:hypothetical protein
MMREMPPQSRITAASVAANSGQICLGFQWDAASWDTVPSLWESLFAWIDDRNVHWNLPALPIDMPLRKRTAVLKPLKSRIERRGDIVTAMGFSGAVHPLLNMDELEREVSWGLKNPWGTGITDVLGVCPTILIPRVADPWRPAAWKLYGEHGFGKIGVFPDPGDLAAETSAGCLFFIRTMASSCPPGSLETRRLKKLLAASPNVRLQLDLSGVTDQDAVRKLLEAPGGLFGGRPPAFSPLAELSGPLPARYAGRAVRLDWAPFSLPGLHAALEKTAGISRKKRKKTEEYGALLSQLGAIDDELQAEVPGKAEDPRRHLRLVAHMLGEVSLAGSSFDVRLQGGRFSGVTRQGKELMPLLPARSFFRVGRSLWQYRTVSSFSFESDHGTGLREELRIDGAQGSLVSIEYSFRDDSPLLSIALEMRFPDIPAGAQVDEYAPLALPLRLLKKRETATIEISAPDGSTSSVEVSEETGSVLAPGALHRIRRVDGGWIVLQFASAERTAWGLPSFRVTRARGARVLEANPFGSNTAQPGPALSGRHASFSLRLGLEDA